MKELKECIEELAGVKEPEPKATVGDYLSHAMKQPDVSIRTGFVERLENTQAGNLKRIDIDAGFKAIGEALDRRRGYLDEMEKLIGVRNLEQHPNGVSGAVFALLGVTNQLETKSRIGWDTFVIGELISLITSVGTNDELVAAIAAKRADNMERLAFVPGGFKSCMKMSPELKAALGMNYPRPIEEVKEWVACTVKEEWNKLNTGPRSLMLTSGDLEAELEANVEKAIAEMPTLEHYTFVVDTLHTWEGLVAKMRVSVTIKRNGSPEDVVALTL